MSQDNRATLGRRGLLTAAGALAAGLAGTAGSAAAADPARCGPVPFGPVSVRPGDPRYESPLLADSQRFVGRPDEVRVVGSTQQVGKAAYLKRSYTDTQLSTIYRHLTNDTGTPACGMLLIGYGGQVRAVEPTATAVAQRDAVMKAVFHSIWAKETDDDADLTWLRELYREVYGDTGGVPVPGEVSDGSYVNYPDVDLADPSWNTSGVPWHTLYYKDNYPRLQRVKARWDPLDVFHHALSVQLPR
ncbi:BBE domain-containing protein [Kitasatospora azatica]|uniref:BBE domain-containing protein n=1 Tax=Kitasatospora azatica TaxID=58347 RepID=UPI000ACCB7B7|nr:BBE domain-containing protein [Kitasatospora azatica]